MKNKLATQIKQVSQAPSGEGKGRTRNLMLRHPELARPAPEGAKGPGDSGSSVNGLFTIMTI